MNQPVKFLFDHDFKAAEKAKPVITPADHEAGLKDADAAGYRRGYETAKAEAQADVERRTAAALERIAATIEGFARGLSAVEARLETEAVEVALAVARKLVPSLIEREPLAEITALATNCFRHLVAAPHVAVRVNEAQHEAVSRKLEEIARARGLDSKLVVLAEPDIAIGDCRIEWADGGVTRDRSAITAAVEDAVTRYVNARHIAADMQESPWRSDR
jgi:flagellar assembly protein FliH